MSFSQKCLEAFFWTTPNKCELFETHLKPSLGDQFEWDSYRLNENAWALTRPPATYPCQYSCPINLLTQTFHTLQQLIRLTGRVPTNRHTDRRTDTQTGPILYPRPLMWEGISVKNVFHLLPKFAHLYRLRSLAKQGNNGFCNVCPSACPSIWLFVCLCSCLTSHEQWTPWKFLIDVPFARQAVRWVPFI